MTKILGINLSDLSKPKLLDRLDFFLNDSSSHFLVTPNPEIILQAQHNEEYFYILNSADIAIADGFGLILAGLIQGHKIPRITGSDLTPVLLERAAKNKIKTLIINWQGGLSQESDIKKILDNRWPELDYKILDTDKKDHLTSEETAIINDFAPKLIFVTLGAPLQERLIWNELKNWPSARLALAVGGSFDFLTKKIKRAPKIMRVLGLEWLWRLLLQPKRLKRIWRATAVFGWKVVKTTFILPFFYRPNVAIMLYKKTAEGARILVVARQEDHNHWQLPQGGTDGETIAVAGARELREESGTDKFIPIKSFTDIYRYKFSKARDNLRHTGYKGQKQGLFIAEFTGNDSDIKINYWDHAAWQWISTDKLLETIHPCRREGTTIFLKKFLETVK